METALSLVEKYGFGLVAFCAILAFVGFMIRVLTKIGIEEAIKAEFAKEIEKYKSELQAGLQAEIEGLKTSLVKSETMFTRQLEALTVLRRIYRGILPKKRYSDGVERRLRGYCSSFKKHANDLGSGPIKMLAVASIG